MSNYKVTILIDDCDSAEQAKIWAREAPGPILKVSKIRKPYDRSGPYEILKDGTFYAGDFKNKTRAVKCLRAEKHYLKSQGITGTLTISKVNR